MPTSAAYARRLLQQGKAQWVPHHAFPVIQLTHAIQQPTLRPILIGVAIHLNAANLYLIAEGEQAALPLLHTIVDLRTDLPTRLRRRAAHRKRRRNRARYRAPRKHGRPFKLRRPSMLRSAWSQQVHRGRQPTPMRVRHLSHTIRWRSQAIMRVICALQKLLPISHAIILSPAELRGPQEMSGTALRQLLIDTYGQIDTAGNRHPMCAYCLTTEGRIEAEHIIPRSRGGTDGWQNRVLACAACNARKGNRLPEEADMPLRIPLHSEPASPNRAGSYARATGRALIESLRVLGLPTRLLHQADDPRTHWPVALYPELLKIWETSDSVAKAVAKPISRPSKQVFTGRNYPLDTKLRPGMVRLGSAIRRRVQVNRAIVIEIAKTRRAVRIIGANEPIPASATQVIMLGALCEGLRREQRVVGIVAALHTAGRLTLLVPENAGSTGVNWRRVVISPRRHLRILSTDPIIFLPLPTRDDHAS
ncbi:hypothetical protein EKD04_014615 [Chloroflexales bacterium ZM16-3]|nr:hypothetical protein [Chloroflexales bacterium ZM16-3]